MTEHQLTRDPAGCDKPGSLRFVEGLDQRVRIGVGNLANELGGEHPAEHCGRDQHLAG